MSPTMCRAALKQHVTLVSAAFNDSYLHLFIRSLDLAVALHKSDRLYYSLMHGLKKNKLPIKLTQPGRKCS